MKKAEEVEKEFREDLQAILDKYGAELEAKDHYRGIQGCGQDIRVTVTIPAKYDSSGEQVSEWTEISLGQYLS